MKKKPSKDCDYFYDKKGKITKVLIPLDQLQKEYNSTMIEESPLFEIYLYIEEFNDEK